ALIVAVILAVTTLFDVWEVAAKPSHCAKDCKQDIKNCLALVPNNRSCTGTKAEKKACRKMNAGQRKTCRSLVKLCKQQNPGTSGVCLLSSTTHTTTTTTSSTTTTTIPTSGGTGAFGIVTVNGKQKMYLPQTSLNAARHGIISVVNVGVAGNGIAG